LSNQFVSRRYLTIAALAAIVGLTGLGQVWAHQMSAPEFQAGAMSAYGFEDTVDMLKGTIEAQNLMLIQEIDAQRMLRMVGVQTGGMKQLLFFHPRYMKRIREANAAATLEPPLKIAVMERPDGKVMVRYIKPSYLFGRYDGLEDIGAELEQLVETVVASVKS